MSAAKVTRKKQGKDPESLRSVKKARENEDFDPDLSNDITGIISALQQIKEKAQQEGQKKSEETIASVAAEVKSMLDDAKSKLEKERTNTQRKKEKTMLSEAEKASTNKIAAAEELLKKKKQDSKSFSILRKSLGSFLDCGSDEDFPPDDD
ncbi:hypothetical protein ACLOJK_001175 [Asimina triloba]